MNVTEVTYYSWRGSWEVEIQGNDKKELRRLLAHLEQFGRAHKAKPKEEKP